jgi:hypothetical protein
VAKKALLEGFGKELSVAAATALPGLMADRLKDFDERQ